MKMAVCIEQQSLTTILLPISLGGMGHHRLIEKDL